jgi:hypothetical protein
MKDILSEEVPKKNQNHKSDSDLNLCVFQAKRIDQVGPLDEVLQETMFGLDGALAANYKPNPFIFYGLSSAPYLCASNEEKES